MPGQGVWLGADEMSARSIYFPPCNGATSKREDPLDVYGELVREHRKIGRVLAQIPLERDGRHGHAQAILAAAKILQEKATLIIEERTNDTHA